MLLRYFVITSTFFLSFSLSFAAPLNLDLQKFHNEAIKRFKTHFPKASFIEKGIWLSEGYSNGDSATVLNESTLAQVLEFPMSGQSNHIAVGFRLTGEWFIRFADFQATKKSPTPTLHYRYSDTFTGKVKKDTTAEQIENVIQKLNLLFPKADVDRHFFQKFKMILIGGLEPQEWFQVYDYFRENTEIVESIFPAPPGRWIMPFSFLPSVYLGDGSSSSVLDLNQHLLLPGKLNAQGKDFSNEITIPAELHLETCIEALSSTGQKKI